MTQVSHLHHAASHACELASNFCLGMAAMMNEMDRS